MNAVFPRYSIFVPVRNGGEHLRLCVKSVLDQSYRDFELIILENQSSDGTAEWLQAKIKEDSRIRVIPSRKSLSIEENWHRILDTPKAEFMTIIGHDDIFETDFLQEINLLIQREPAANLYLTHFKLIDSGGRLIRHCRPIPRRETATEFLAARMSEMRDSFGTGYVMRSVHYDKLGGIPSFANLLYADDALWMGLMQDSYKATSLRVCFSYRFHSGSVSGAQDFDTLFIGLKQYLSLLSKWASEDKEIAATIERYAPVHLGHFFRAYLNYLAWSTPWTRQFDHKKIEELEVAIKGLVPQVVLDKSAMAFNRRLLLKFGFWIKKRWGIPPFIAMFRN